MATYTVTNSFSADGTAIASEVNANFTDVLAALNALDAANLTGSIAVARISGLTTTQFAAATLVTEAEGLASSDNDTSLPTTAAIIDYVAGKVGSANWTPTSYAGEESITFPNGLIMKHGFIADAGGSTTVTFAAAFPTAIISASVTPDDTTSQGLNYVVHTYSTTIIRIDNTNALDGYHWQAWGY